MSETDSIKPSDSTFERWIKYNFDHPVTEPAWLWKDNDGNWDEWDEDQEETPALTVALLTRAFENAREVFAPYSDAQLNQSFWLILSPGALMYMFALTDENVPWAERKRAIQSIYTLFEQIFAEKCSSHLNHLQIAGEPHPPTANPLDSVCYVWWDILPIDGQPDNPARAEMDAEILDVMKRMLTLDSDACRESALHGLDHWRRHYLEYVEATIDQFLAKNPQLRPELRKYALRARKGHVL